MTSGGPSGTNFWLEGVERAPTLQATPGPEQAAETLPAVIEPPRARASGPATQHPEPIPLKCGVRMRRALDVEPREIDWLWVGRVPLGMTTMFAGDPKLGKSYVTLAMAAALSRGDLCP